MIDPALVPSAVELRVEPDPQDLFGQTERDDTTAHREHVRIVVRARQARRVEVVAQRGANPDNLVGGDLFALSAAADHDAAIGAPLGDGSCDGEADRRVVDRLFAVRAMVVDRVPEMLQRAFEMFFERKAGVIGTDGDTHHVTIPERRTAYRDPRTTKQNPRTLNPRTVAAMLPAVVISPRGEDRLRSGHPWIYRADIADVHAEGGDVVFVRSRRGHPVGRALYSDRSQIALRLLTFGASGADEDPVTLIRARLDGAIAFRESLRIDATAYRLVHGEADLLPSLIVDRYGDYLVVQALSQGMDRLLPSVVSALRERLQPRGILARNDPRARTLDGLEQRVDVLAGEVPERIDVTELGIEYNVDLRHGQKTGLFLDQRENRAAAAAYAHGRLLDCFSYHGGFALGLGRRSRETIAVDVSEDAIAQLRANAVRNGVAIDARVGNVFDELRGLERLGERFDTIVLDPPAFAKNKAAVANACAGYKEINLRAMKLLRPDGILITCSCSYHMNEAMFAEIVYEAAVDAQAQVSVVEKRMQGRDHPVLFGMPETYYLKCFILRKLA